MMLQGIIGILHVSFNSELNTQLMGGKSLKADLVGLFALERVSSLIQLACLPAGLSNKEARCCTFCVKGTNLKPLV